MADVTSRHATHTPSGRREPWSWASRISLIGFLAIAGVFLWTEHREHFFGALLFLLLLACPLLHFFRHGRRGGHGGHDDETYGRHGGTR